MSLQTREGVLPSHKLCAQLITSTVALHPHSHHNRLGLSRSLLLRGWSVVQQTDQSQDLRTQSLSAEPLTALHTLQLVGEKRENSQNGGWVMYVITGKAQSQFLILRDTSSPPSTL